LKNPHEVYLEAIYVGVYRAAIQGLQKFKDIANLDVDEVLRSGMQRNKTHSLEVFAKRYLTVYGTTRKHIEYG
jgi:hypothetical protein